MTEKTTAAVPATVGVLGGGRMGAGIAHAFLIAGSRVTVVEVDAPAAEAAKERVESDLAKSLERGKIDGNLDVWAENFAVSVDYAD
ncbi:MAG: 3-hydroxyacyl-CoA dehydrogenase NAD-binding domain-containing protein, partial [Micrococcaceae bacterium]|nr:3-hydroxyacyl-CoA dehydrogenase NAD-binding domain-containing protein [Micrococcaceae bacterium]